MKVIAAVVSVWAQVAFVLAADGTVSPSMQATLDKQQEVIALWAADPVLVAAVVAQNEKGPLAGMDNDRWGKLKSGDKVVKAFRQNAAGVWLARKVKESGGLFSEAFLSAAKGEKVAFVAKTSRYLHAGRPKFDVPMSGKPWQGDPAFDESSRINAIQIATPVADHGQTIGVLVVGVALEKLSR